MSEEEQAATALAQKQAARGGGRKFGARVAEGDAPVPPQAPIPTSAPSWKRPDIGASNTPSPTPSWKSDASKTPSPPPGAGRTSPKPVQSFVPKSNGGGGGGGGAGSELAAAMAKRRAAAAAAEN